MKKIMLAACLVLLSSVVFAEAANFQLQKGWNLIPKNYTVNTACNNNFRIGYQYSPLENKYYVGFGNDLTGLDDPRLQDLQQFSSLYKVSTYPTNTYYNPMSANPGNTSLWVYLDNSCKITEPRPISETISKIDRKVYAGWNFLAITENWLNQSPREIFQNCTVQKIYGWNGVGQSWVNTSGVQMDQKFGQADIDQTVVVKVASECKLSGTLSPPGLP